MSSRGDADRGGERAREALARLEKTVGGLLREIEDLRERLRKAEKRTEVLEGELSLFVEGELEPGALVDRLGDLEERNRDLSDRLDQGRAGVERLLARIRFLEEQAS